MAAPAPPASPFAQLEFDERPSRATERQKELAQGGPEEAEQAFGQWFGEVARYNFLHTDPHHESNAGFNYAAAWLSGYGPREIPELKRQLAAHEAAEATPEPAARAEGEAAVDPLYDAYRLARAEGLKGTDLDTVLEAAEPAYGELTPEERAPVLGQLQVLHDDAVERTLAPKLLGPDVTRWLRPQGLFEQGWIDEAFGPHGREIAEEEKRTMLRLYEGMNRGVAGILHQAALGVNLIEYGLTGDAALRAVAEDVRDQAERRSGRLPAHLGHGSPPEKLTDVHDLVKEAFRDAAEPGVASRWLYAKSEALFRNADTIEDFVWDPAKDRTGFGKVLRASSVGAGEFLTVLPYIRAGAGLLGGYGRFFVGQGALLGAEKGFREGEPTELLTGSAKGAVGGALTQLMFTAGGKVGRAGLGGLPAAAQLRHAMLRQPTVTGGLFGALAMMQSAPPEEVAAQAFIGLGLGAFGVRQHYKAQKGVVAAMADEANRRIAVAALNPSVAELRELSKKDVLVDSSTGQLRWSFAADPPTHLEQIASTSRVADMALRGEMPVRDAYHLLAERALDSISVPRSQQKLILRAADGQAEAWAENHSRTPDEWYLMSSFVAGAEGGTRTGDVVLTARKRDGNLTQPPRGPEQIDLPLPETIKTPSPYRYMVEPEQAKGRLQRLFRRQPGTGGPKFSRTELKQRMDRAGIQQLPEGMRLVRDDLLEVTLAKGENRGKSVFVGRMTPTDAQRFIDQHLPHDAAFQRAYRWYDDAVPMYEAFFGKQDGPLVAALHFAAWRNKAGGASFADMAFAVEQELGGGGPVVGKKGQVRKVGPAATTLSAMLKGTKGQLGPKLQDFIDSLLGKPTRTIMGDHHRGGSPFVVDVWMPRAAGFLTATSAFSPQGGLRAQLTPEQLRVLELLPVDLGRVHPKGLAQAELRQLYKEGREVELYNTEGGAVTRPAPGEPMYEYISEWGNQLSRYFNTISYRGIKNWSPRNAQAVLWIATQNAYRAANDYPEDAIVRNSRRISMELRSDTAPYKDDYNALDTLGAKGLELQQLVTARSLARSVSAIAKRIGVPLREDIRVGSGAWGTAFNASGWIDHIGSRETAVQMADALGYLYGQHSVLVSRMLPATPSGKPPTGTQPAIVIREKAANGRLKDDAVYRRFATRLMEEDPRIAKGADRAVTADGRFGLRVFLPAPNPAYYEGGKASAEFKRDVRSHREVTQELASEKPGQLAAAIDRVERELGLEVDWHRGFAEVEPVDAIGGNQGGRLQRLTAGGRRDLSEWLEREFSGAEHRRVAEDSQAALAGKLDAQLERDVRKGDLFNATHSRIGVDVARRGIREDLISLEARARAGPQVGRVVGQTELSTTGISLATPALIRLFDGADLTTVAHELGHVLRATLTPREVAIAERLYGVKQAGNWQRADHERFAEDFERYLASGEIRDPARGKIFGKLATAMRAIYQKVAPTFLSDGTLSLEQKAQFERWLSPARARFQNPRTVGLEEAIPWSLDEVQMRMQPRDLKDPRLIWELVNLDPTASGVKKYADNINTTKIRDAADVKVALAYMADRVGEESRPRVPAPVTYQMMIAAAEESGFKNVEQFLRSRGGKPLDYAQLTSARSLLYAVSRDFVTASHQASQTRAPEQIAEAYRLMFLHKAVRDQLSGQVTAVARALGSLRMMLDVPGAKQRAEMIDIVLNQGGGPDNILKFLDLVSATDGTAGLSRLVDAHLEGSFGRALTELWVMGLLSGARTHVRNFLSNFGVAAMAPPTAFMAANIGLARRGVGKPIEMLMGDRAPRFFTNHERVLYGEAVARAAGYWAGGLTGMKLVGKVLANQRVLDGLAETERPSLQGVRRAVEAGRGLEVGRVEQLTSSRGILGEAPIGDFRAGAIPGIRRLPETGLGGAVRGAVDIAGDVARIPGLGLEVGDALFKSLGYSSEIYAQAYRRAAKEFPFHQIGSRAWRLRLHELMSHPTQSMLEAADYNAAYATFTQPLGPIGKKLLAARNDAPILRLLIPFMLAPTNIHKMSIEYSPVAPIFKKVRSDIRLGGPEADTALAKMSLGAMILGAGVMAGAMGQSTGSGPFNPLLRPHWLQRKQPDSFFIGDPESGVGQYLAYSSFEPFSSLFSVGSEVGSSEAARYALANLAAMVGFTANFAEVAGEAPPDALQEVAQQAVKAVIKQFPNKTWWRSVAELGALFTEPDTRWSRFSQGYARSIVPRVIVNWENYVDPEWRDTQTALDAIKANIPGYSKDLMPNTNLFGEPILFEGGVGPDMASPLYVKNVASDPVMQEIVRLGMKLSMPSRELDGVELDPEEYFLLKSMGGGAARKLLNHIVDDQLTVNPSKEGAVTGAQRGLTREALRDEELLYSNLNDLEREAVIRGVIHYAYNADDEEYKGARTMLRLQLWQENPERFVEPLKRQLGKGLQRRVKR